jgi:hypothetical protein
MRANIAHILSVFAVRSFFDRRLAASFLQPQLVTVTRSAFPGDSGNGRGKRRPKWFLLRELCKNPNGSQGVGGKFLFRSNIGRPHGEHRETIVARRDICCDGVKWRKFCSCEMVFQRAAGK